MPAATLATLLLHQRGATLDARERLSALVTAAPPRRDAIAMITCHRVELYAIDSGEGRATFASILRSSDPVLDEATVLSGREAARHLFRVAVGLDSAIVGEGQIGNQVRRTYDAARSRGLDAALASLYQRALHLARVVRATTPLGNVRRSIGSLAVDEGLAHVRAPDRATALVIGAGEIGKLAARALARRVGRLIVANRDGRRGADLAGSVGAEAVGLEGLDDALERADLVISAAATRAALLTRERLARRAGHGPLVLIDIAVPRSVADDARDLPGLVYRDVDGIATDASTVPSDVVALAEARCADEADAFMRWTDQRASGPTIRALHERADVIKQRQLARALRHLGHLSDRDREVVRSLATSLTRALIHEPTVRLRAAPGEDRAVRELFDL